MGYEDLITFKRLKEVIEEKNLKVSEIAEKIGVVPTAVSAMIGGTRFPKTDMLAKICWAVGENVDNVCEFKGIEPTEYQREWFKRIGKVYVPDAEAKGDVTYRPLRRVLDLYLEERNRNSEKKMTINDFFDKVEAPRKRDGTNVKSRKGIQAALASRGLAVGSRTETRSRRDYTHGLPYPTRTKLRHDRPLNIRTIYEICRTLGCTPGYVMSYK